MCLSFHRKKCPMLGVAAICRSRLLQLSVNVKRAMRTPSISPRYPPGHLRQPLKVPFLNPHAVALRTSVVSLRVQRFGIAFSVSGARTSSGLWINGFRKAQGISP